MKQIIFRFGLLAAAMLLLFQLSKFSLFTRGHFNELFLAIFAGFFLLFGFLLRRLTRTQKGKPRYAQILSQSLVQEKVVELGISKREYEVLQEIGRGLSNFEIAQTLFISESTVKTHVSNLLLKLEAKRRTEAVRKAQRLNILH